MNITELKEKIDHARSLGHNELPQLAITDVPKLIEKRSLSNKPYLTYIDEDDNRQELTYKEFCNKVFGVALFMQKKGLRHGDRIATISHNHWQTIVQYFAAWLLGLVVVPVNLGEDDERIAYILENGNIELAFIRTDYKERILHILEKYDNLKTIETILCEETVYNYWEKEGELKLEEENLAESEALIVFTSGTTGAPKGVVLSQRNLLEDARSISLWHNIDDTTRMMCVLPFTMLMAPW